jgi:hypothetical protein
MRVILSIAAGAFALAGSSTFLQARDCAPGETSFTLVSTQRGVLWNGIRLSISRCAHAGASLPSRAPSKDGNRLAKVSLDFLPASRLEQDAPSLLSDGSVRFSSNVWSFARRFTVSAKGIDAVDLAFCSGHQINLHCGSIVDYASEGAVSMDCSLSILDPAQIVTP